jgi:hypothetical protein
MYPLKTPAVVARLEQMPDAALSEMASADLSTLEEYLVFLREHYGYGLALGWADVDLDRSLPSPRFWRATGARRARLPPPDGPVPSSGPPYGARRATRRSIMPPRERSDASISNPATWT